MICEKNEYRHVCFKDLENYFRKDLYFSDLTESEKELIRHNLDIPSNEESINKLVVDTYDNISSLSSTGSLILNNIYIINDFKSIYEINGEVLGDTYIPSKEYQIVLHPSSQKSFDPRVFLIDKESQETLPWIVEYSIESSQLSDGTYTKGKITYLKDQNNNSAYYDFKNIRFKRTVAELNKGANTYTQDQYLYTFDSGGNDFSDNINCKNNRLDVGAFNNIFLSTAQNNTLASDVHNNTFFKSCENNQFYYGTRNNYILDDIRMCKGTVHDKELSEVIAMQCPKEFNVLNGNQILIYLDSDTQTFQIKTL